MALARGEINPLNLLGQRKLPYIPPHFGTVSLYSWGELDLIDQWIYYNLNSRYCIRMKQELDSNRKVIDVCEIGMEDPRELTMFNLACPLLHKL